MKRVAVFGLPLAQEVDLGSYVLYPVGTTVRWPGSLGFGRRLLTHGLSGISRARLVLEARGVDELYRLRDPVYMQNCERLLREAAGADALVFFTYPFLHPEIIASAKPAAKLVMGFVDDPHSTYLRGLPYAWAYDAVFHISPSYSARAGFAQMLREAGVTRSYWLPLVQPVPMPQLTFEQVMKRTRDVCYVGNPTFSKVQRLARIKHEFGTRFEVFGRWPARGYAGFLRPLLGERGYYHRVRSISAADKQALYLATKIGLNMHVSDEPAESGNMRTYEATAHGMMLLCDRGAGNLQTQIFAEGTEAVYYDDLDDALAKLKTYLRDDQRRSEIAWRGHLRARQQYSFETVWRGFCEWLFAAGQGVE